MNHFDRSRLNYKNILRNFEGGLYGKYRYHLPYISAKKFEGNVLTNRVFHNLGKDICHLDIKIYQITPSCAILEINAHLSETHFPQVK